MNALKKVPLTDYRTIYSGHDFSFCIEVNNGIPLLTKDEKKNNKKYLIKDQIKIKLEALMGNSENSLQKFMKNKKQREKAAYCFYVYVKILTQNL